MVIIAAMYARIHHAIRRPCLSQYMRLILDSNQARGFAQHRHTNAKAAATLLLPLKSSQLSNSVHSVNKQIPGRLQHSADGVSSPAYLLSATTITPS